MSNAWEPIGHRPPLPPIKETLPTRHEPPQLIPEHARRQIEEIERKLRAKEGERVWQHVVDVAKGG